VSSQLSSRSGLWLWLPNCAFLATPALLTAAGTALAGTAPPDTLDINAEQMAQLTGIYKLSDGSISIRLGPELDTDRIVLAHHRSIPPQDSIRLASNERAGRGSAN
jgi:hypothetical protein